MIKPDNVFCQGKKEAFFLIQKRSSPSGSELGHVREMQERNRTASQRPAEGDASPARGGEQCLTCRLMKCTHFAVCHCKVHHAERNRSSPTKAWSLSLSKCPHSGSPYDATRADMHVRPTLTHAPSKGIASAHVWTSRSLIDTGGHIDTALHCVHDGTCNTIRYGLDLGQGFYEAAASWGLYDIRAELPGPVGELQDPLLAGNACNSRDAAGCATRFHP